MPDVLRKWRGSIARRRTTPGESARQPAHRAGTAGARAPRKSAHRDADPQYQPHGRTSCRTRSPTYGMRACPTTPSISVCRLGRQSSARSSRAACPRPGGDTNITAARALGGRMLGAALAQVPRRAEREHHHRQRGALRRDCREAYFRASPASASRSGTPRSRSVEGVAITLAST